MNTKELEKRCNELFFQVNEKTERIAELERKIASIRGCHRVDLAKLNARTEQVERLKKENAELKKWQKDTIKARGNDYMDWSRMKDQLAKAKEIIKKLYSHVFQGMDFMELIDYNIQKAEAEQFLEENA
jgi:small-conductance mechanosensitive channel